MSRRQRSQVRLILGIVGIAIPILLAASLFGGSNSTYKTNHIDIVYKTPTLTGIDTIPTIDISMPFSPTEPVVFKQDEEGYRLYVNRGVVNYRGEHTSCGWGEPWIGSSRLLVTWLSPPSGGQRVHQEYMLNLNTGLMEQLPGFTAPMCAEARSDSKKAVLIGTTEDGISQRIYLSDVERNSVETVFDLDRTSYSGQVMKHIQKVKRWSLKLET